MQPTQYGSNVYRGIRKKYIRPILGRPIIVNIRREGVLNPGKWYRIGILSAETGTKSQRANCLLNRPKYRKNSKKDKKKLGRSFAAQS